MTDLRAADQGMCVSPARSTTMRKYAAPVDEAETDPLLSKLQTLREAYSFSPHCTMEDGAVVDYDAYKLSSLRALCATQGTVLMDPILFFEQLMYTLIFLGCGLPVYFMQSKYFRFFPEAERQATHDKLIDQEDNMRKFSLIMTMLASFLLSLYTSIMVKRWWTIRTEGVGAIKAATSELVMTVSQFVTKDQEVISALTRNSRASLKLIFLWRRGQLADHAKVRDVLVNENQILTDAEVDVLLSPEWNHNLYESIWTWNVSIIRQLWDEGLIKSSEMLVYLMDKCSVGRGGVQTAATHLAVRVPLMYVHLLCFIVKMHNTICAVLMGVLFGLAIKERNWISCVQLLGRTLLMPFIFNAILLINAELGDPFDGGPGGFLTNKYDNAIKADAHSFIEALENAPPWLAKRRKRTLNV